MAKQMSYTDGFGEVYPASYWRCVQVNACKEDKTARATFYGFASADHKGKRTIGEHSYTISNADFDTYFSASALKAVDVYAQSYVYADNTKDVATDQKDENGNIILKHFFEGATDV